MNAARIALSAATLLSGLILPSAVLAEGLRGPARFQANPRLVLVPVTVTDDRGAPVFGLASGSFSVFERNRPQRILSFSEEEVPCSIGLIIDVSGSMKHKAGLARAALRAFVGAAEPSDEALLMTVSDRPSLERGFTRDLESLLGRMMMRPTGGGTALIDTVYLGLDQMRSARHRRRALVVISDGMDNHSRFSAHELLSAAMESDVEIHTLAIEAPPVNAKAAELNDIGHGLAFLSALSHRSGGLHYVVSNPSAIAPAAANIGRALRSRYILGFRPEEFAPDGQWRPIRIRLSLPGRHVHTREGYYAR
jgi:Ca-activated chloride channel family protein